VPARDCRAPLGRARSDAHLVSHRVAETAATRGLEADAHRAGATRCAKVGRRRGDVRVLRLGRVSIVVIDDMLLIRVEILLSDIFEGWVTNLAVNSSGIEMS